MPFENTISKPSINDFKKIFSFTATGLKPNTYYDVICQSKKSNHCVTQRDQGRDNPYSKTLKRIGNLEIPTNVVLVVPPGLTGGINDFETPSNLPIKTNAEGEVAFEFDGNVWISDGGTGTNTSSTTTTNLTIDYLRTLGNLVLEPGIKIQFPNIKNGYVLNFSGGGGQRVIVLESQDGSIAFYTPFYQSGIESMEEFEQLLRTQDVSYSKAFASVDSVTTTTTVTSLNVSLRESNYIDPKPAVPPTPIGPPSPPIGWSTTKPEVPANTTTERTVSSSTVTTSRDLGVLNTRKQFGTGGETPLSEVSLYFDYAQTFYLDPAQFDNSQYVTLTGINLYFKSKPNATNNQSGLVRPGVYLFLCDAENDVPNLKRAYRESIIRKRYGEINASLSSSDFTDFSFRNPIPLKTGKSYAFVINFEDPQYSLWTATQGVKLLNSEDLCDSAYNFGKLYRAANYLEIDNDPKTQDDVLKPLPATDLKFDITGLSYADDNGNFQSVNVELVHDDYEFIEISNIYSKIYGFVNIYQAFGNRQYIYQDFGNTSANVFYYKEGTVKIEVPPTGDGAYPGNSSFVYIEGLTAPYTKSTVITGIGTSFRKELTPQSLILLTDGISSDSNGYVANTCIRRITKVVNNTVAIINDPCFFSANAGYYKVPAVAKMEHAFQNPDTLVLIESNANEDVYFVANAVNYITFTGGTGYQNTDYITFTGANAKTNGRASITTNSTGGIVSINITNTGYGFTSSPVVTLYTQNGVAGGSGSSATFQVSVGGQIKGEIAGPKADIVGINSFPINNFIPNLDFNIKGGTVSNNSINFSIFDTNANTYNLLDSNFKPVISGQSSDITEYDALVMSKSLEVLNRNQLVGTTAEGKSSLIKFTISSTNRYDSPELHEELTSLFVFNNEINNDATDEHTNFGNAVTRHISKKITFDKDRYAEDIRVILTAYKPPGTDVKVFAKVHNSKDEDAFDDKTWSELELKDATFDGREFSSRGNKNDFIELTYGFKNYPDFTTTIAGDAFVYSTAGNTTVTGVGTAFNTDLANGDLIVLYDEQFPNTTYGVAMVANTPVATSFEINKEFSNISLESATLKIGKVTKPYMVFNDVQNDNVATYYSTSINEFTTYDTFAVKLVLLSNSSYIVPRVNDIRAIGVSV
jgi:hypothetical protein